MGKYKDRVDMIMKTIDRLSKENPGIAKGFMSMHKATTEDASLSVKVKELMGLAIGINVRCEGCISLHMAGALKAGATKEEIAETIGVSVLMGGGPALVYSGIAYEVLEELTK